MKGLLLKDVYTLFREMGVFLLIIIFFAVVGGSMSAFAVVYAALLPVTALTYDERSKWDSLAAMMPFSVREIVLSKYFLGYVCIALTLLLSTAAQPVAALIQGVPFNGQSLLSLLMSACIAAILLAVNLPFMFSLGVEKGRIVFFIMIAVTVFIGMNGAAWMNDVLLKITASPTMGAALCILVAAVVNVVSTCASVSLYRRRRV